MNTPMNDRLDPSAAPIKDVEDTHAGALKIEYTTTEIVREAAAVIRRRPGAVGTQRSELSEAFKVLRTQIMQRMRSNGWRSIAITSVGLENSKSMASVNLALTLAAEYDKTALLVDANLANPQIGTLFGLERRKGLRDFLIDNVPLKDLIVNPGIEHLVVLPAGAAVSNSAELLATDASTRLFQELQGRYPQRYIIFDAPSVLTADGLSLFEKVDAVLVVAERNRTTRAELEQCALALKPFNLIGSVLCEAIPEAALAPDIFGAAKGTPLRARKNL